MAKLNSKDIKSFSNDLKKLNDSLESITGNVDDINNQFEGYNEEINNIKDNVKSLENELITFINDTKLSPVIEDAKKQIEKSEAELEKKYSKHNNLRDKYLEIINSIENNEISKDIIPSGNELMPYNIPNYYLSYVLLAVIAWINNNKKSCDKYVNQALELDKEKTSLALLTLYTKLNKTDVALKWLKYYLDLIDPTSTNNNIVKVLQLVQNNVALLNEIISHFKKWAQDLDEEEYNKITDEWISFFGLNKNYITDSYQYIFDHCKAEELIQDLNDSYAYSNSYNKLVELLNNNNECDINKEIIYLPEFYEEKIKDVIVQNKLIIKNNGKKIERKNRNDRNIFVVLVNSLYSKKYNKKTKETILYLSKKYILNIVDDKKLSEIKIQIGAWEGLTTDGSNETQLVNDITNYVKDPFDKDINDLKIVNFKTIYSSIFLVAGLIVMIFNLTIGAAMVLVGMGMLFYFINNLNNTKKELENLYLSTLDTYVIELNDTLAEIVDINILMNKNNSNKNKLIDYIINNNGGKNE